METTNEDRDKVIKALLFVGGTLVVIHYADKWLNEQKKKELEGKAAKDASVGYALALRTAMNPSGNRWMFYFDGTDTEAIFRVADQITDLKAVEDAYSTEYGKDSLLQDLQSELSAADSQKFLALASKGQTGSKYYAPDKLKVPIAYYVLTKAKTNLRSAAKKIPKSLIGGNIIKTADAGKLIGLTTGKAVYDEAGDTVFLEVVYLTKKQEKKFLYVAKSQVELISKEEKAKREVAAPLHYEILDGINGLTGLFSDSDLMLLTIKPATIINQQRKAVAKVPVGVTLGVLEMRLNTDQGTWLKFTSVQGFKRWVKESEVRLVTRK